MVITDNFVFIHMPKTAGQFVRDTLLEIVPGAQKQADHQLRSNLSSEHAELPVFGFVRNPWDWYVSWYHYFQEFHKHPIFRHYSDNGSKDFKTTVTRLLYFEERTENPVDQLSSKFDFGFYTWRLRHLFSRQDGDFNDVTFGRFENLVDDLFDQLDKHGVQLDKRIKKDVKKKPKFNTSKHDDYRTYYDSELVDLVAKRETLFIEKFGYAFE